MNCQKGIKGSMQRYSVLTEGLPREVVLLRGNGCIWKQCTFCDYYLDASSDAEENFTLNQQVLRSVTGVFQRLEVLNSGSFQELDPQTQEAVLECCQSHEIREVITEVHWAHRKTLGALKERFRRAGVTLKIKLGLETFDAQYRQQVLHKGIPDCSIEELRAFADHICLLFGLPGQTMQSMRRDLNLGLQYFERVCVNLMVENSAPLQPDEAVRMLFIRQLSGFCRAQKTIDLLLENTDFGVGREENTLHASRLKDQENGEIQRNE